MKRFWRIVFRFWKNAQQTREAHKSQLGVLCSLMCPRQHWGRQWQLVASQTNFTTRNNQGDPWESHLVHTLIEITVRSQWGCERVVAGHDYGSKGVAILFKNNFEYKIHTALRNNEGRYILTDIEMMNKRLTLANVYAPSSGDHSEFFWYSN